MRAAALLSLLGPAVAAGALGTTACVLFRSDDALTSGGALVDAASEAATGDDAGSLGGFCATRGAGAALCDDFDREPLSARWTENVDGASKIELDASRSASPPRSLSVSVAPDLADCSYVRIEHALPDVKGRTTLSVALVPPDLADELDLLTLEIGESGNGACRFLVRWGPSTTALVEQLDVRNAPGRTTITPRPREGDTDAFRRLELGVDLDAATVDLAIDGTSILGGPKALAHACAARSPAFVALGAHCRSGGAGTLVRFDDVLLTTR